MVDLYNPLERRLFARRNALFRDGEGGCLFFGKGRDIFGQIAFHLDNAARLMEIRAGTAGHQDGGDAIIPIEFLYPVDKGRNRFRLWMDDTLHQFVTDHKVGGAGIFVN